MIASADRSDRTAVRATPLSSFAYVAPFCAGGTALLGVLNLAAWAMGRPMVEAITLGGTTTVPNSALGFIVAALALLFLARPHPSRARRAAGVALAVVPLVLGIVYMLREPLSLGPWMDMLLFPSLVGASGGASPGRVALNSALAFVLVGGALLTLDVAGRHGFRPAELFGTLTLLIAFLALVGHAYGFEALYTVDPHTGMALTTAVGFALLALGILFARPDRGAISLVTVEDASGIFLRRILPTGVLMPVFLGWAWVAARDRELITRDSGVSLFVAAIVAIFVTVVFASASTVRALDRDREALLAREKAARTDAEEANRAKADFLATMSHELRTPLNAITGYTDLLDLELRGPLNPAQHEDVDRIRRSSQYLLGLINDTLNFARLEAGRVEISPDDVPVDDVLAGMETLVTPQVTSRALRYEYRPCDPELLVRADRERLEQILVNLLTNACKFTEPGGRVALWCERRVHEVRIVVQDTGRGIAPEKLARIFEPFVQVDRHLTHESQQGVGLGLAISRDLARAMGGELSATSEPGRGSTFVLTLPRAAGPDETPPPRPAGRRGRQGATAGLPDGHVADADAHRSASPAPGAPITPAAPPAPDAGAPPAAPPAPEAGAAPDATEDAAPPAPRAPTARGEALHRDAD